MVPLVNPYIRGDGNGYYAYVRSVVIDGDLRFANEYRRGDPAFVASVTGSGATPLPEDGYVVNQWAVGSSLLWAPAFLAAHGTVLALDRLGWSVLADGYSAPYRWSCALATAVYGFIGLMLARAAAAQVAGVGAATAATIGMWLASPLPVYMYFLPFHVPALSAFAVSLFLWIWLRTRQGRTARQWFLWGLSGGLMIEVYHLDAVVALIAAVEVGHLARSGNAGPQGARRAAGPAALLFGCGAVLALVPHLAVKWIIHGSPLRSGYEDRFFWGSPRLWQVAFASEHGMFLWTPILALGTAGLVLLWRKDRRMGAALSLVFAAHYYAVASYQNWHGQSAFGSRFFVSLTPVFVLGLAAVLAAAARVGPIARHPGLASGVLLAPLVLWNLGLMFQWGTGLIPNRGPVDFAAVVRNQVALVPAGAARFLARYVSDRTEVTREVEQRDLERVPDYRPRR
jgi:hypothetical protein